MRKISFLFYLMFLLLTTVVVPKLTFFAIRAALGRILNMFIDTVANAMIGAISAMLVHNANLV
jgi:hypothetical protein